MKKKIFSLLIMVGLIISSILPAKINAIEKSTNVVVHKVLLNDKELSSSTKNYDPSKGIENIKDLGSSAEVIEGVYFVAVKEGDENLIFNGDVSSSVEKNLSLQPDSQKTLDYVSSLNKGNYIYGGKTNSSGSISLNLPNGNYKIFEVKSLSTYKGKHGELLSKSKAVPVLLTLPFIGTKGELETVHVYPKNTEEGPSVDKYIKSIGNKDASYAIGEEQTWYIKVGIPSDIKDYKKFIVSDKLDSQLSFIKNSVKVYEYNSDTNAKGSLISDEYYSLAKQPDSNEGGTLEIDFLKGSQNINKYAGKSLIVEFKTFINSTALMGKDIENDAKIVYGHTPDSDNEKNTTVKPKVHTGGRRFIKVDESDNSIKLNDAQFRIARKSSKGEGQFEYLVENKTNHLRYWKQNEIEEATEEYVILSSKNAENTDGYFEIKGLAYGDDNENAANAKYSIYYLDEIKAPDGYAKPSNMIEFKIDANSYADSANDSMLVKNKKQTIPETGGIGTVVFTVSGLLLMATSFIALKKHKSHSK